MDEWGPTESLETPAPFWARGGAERGLGRAPRRDDRMAEIFAEELLPRMLGPARVAAPRAQARTVPRARPVALARALAAHRHEEARAWIARRLRSGATAESVWSEDLAPAARALGDLWRDDDCDFFDVTAAMGELGAALKGLGVDDARAPRAPSILIAPAPEETHLFAADVAACVFRLAGWRAVRCEGAEVQKALARESFEAVGFSLSCARWLGWLPEAVRAARAASGGANLKVVLGGPAFASRAELAAEMGADFCASERDLSPQFPHRVLQAIRL